MTYYTGYIKPWWTNEHTLLDYNYFKVRQIELLDKWRDEGFDSFMRYDIGARDFYSADDCPEFAKPFFTLFNWNNIGISFLKLAPGNGLPEHRDMYQAYKKNLQLPEEADVWRCNIFLEDWQPGHYFDIDRFGRANWRAGEYTVWKNDVSHSAINFSPINRYTMQITGHTV